MEPKMKRFFSILLSAFTFVAPLAAYIDTAPTLGRIIQESNSIVVLEVVQVSREKRVIVYRKVGDLKGQTADSSIRHQITAGLHPREPMLVMDWAQPGRQIGRASCRERV